MQHTCEGMDMGLIKVNVEGAVGKYDLSWTGPLKPNDGLVQKNLKPGTYKVTAEDEAGCSSQLSIRIKNNKPPKADPVVADRSLDLNIAGNGPFKVKWNSDKKEYKLGKSSIKNPQAGKYTYIVSDMNNCFTAGVVSLSDNNE